MRQSNRGSLRRPRLARRGVSCRDVLPLNAWSRRSRPARARYGSLRSVGNPMSIRVRCMARAWRN